MDTRTPNKAVNIYHSRVMTVGNVQDGQKYKRSKCDAFQPTGVSLPEARITYRNILHLSLMLYNTSKWFIMFYSLLCFIHIITFSEKLVSAVTLVLNNSPRRYILCSAFAARALLFSMDEKKILSTLFLSPFFFLLPLRFLSLPSFPIISVQ